MIVSDVQLNVKRKEIIMTKRIQKYGSVSEKYQEMQNYAKKQGGKVEQFRYRGETPSGEYRIVDKNGNIVKNSPSLFWAGKSGNQRFEYKSSDGKTYVSGENDKQHFTVIQYNDGMVAVDKNKDGIVNNNEIYLDTNM